LRGVDASHHLIEGLGARDLLEFCAVERIEADVDAAKAGGDEAVATLGEKMAVGGHREILDAESFQSRDEILYAGADERLSTGHAYLADAHADQDADDALVFVPVEKLADGHVIVRIGRAAIDAAEIAAVGDRNAKVGDLAAEFVGERHTHCEKKSKEPARRRRYKS